MKYLSIILRLMKLSFLEEQSCTKQIELDSPSKKSPTFNTTKDQDLNSSGEDQDNPKVLAFSMDSLDQGVPYGYNQRVKFDAFFNLKHSMIEEVDEEDEKQGGFNHLSSQVENYQNEVVKKSLMRKKAIRSTIKNEGLVGKIDLNKNDYVNLL